MSQGVTDAQCRREFDIPANVRGAVVTNMDEDAPADRAGLHTGDAVLAHFAHARDRLRIERIGPAGKLRALPALRWLSVV